MRFIAALGLAGALAVGARATPEPCAAGLGADWVREGIALSRRGEWTAARERLLAGLRAEPGNLEAVRELASIARAMGDMTTCLRYSESMVALRPVDAAVHFELANLYFFFRDAAAKVRGVGEPDVVRLAQEQYRLARRLAPDEYRYAAALAESLAAAVPPRWDEAEEAWRYCLPLSRDRTAVYCRLARVCLEAGAFDRAEEYLAQARGLRAAELKAELDRRRRAAASVSVGRAPRRDS